MNFVTHELKPNINVNFTHLQGYIRVPYNRLVREFGQPIKESISDEYVKVHTEWHIEWEDGTVSTIYAWKQYNRPRENIVDWNIGGHSIDAVNRIGEILPKTVQYY